MHRLLLGLAIAALLTPALPAQQPAGIADAWAELAGQPATHTSFTFDRSALQGAQALLEQGGLDPDHAAAAISSITIDSFRYQRPAFYTPETMSAILASYQHAGWKHLVNATENPGNSAQPQATITDLWLHFTGADINGVNVLLRGPRSMSVIQLTGDLRPLDLLHLSGHFGIPKVDPNAVMVPDPNQR